MKPARILFVCLGNICRSPLAEGMLRHLAQKANLDVIVDSAGTGGWHIGELPDPRAIAVAHKHGIDLTAQRGRKIAVEDFDAFDLILAMDKSNLRHVRALAPTAALPKVHLLMNYALSRNEPVPDPYYEGPEGFELVYSMLLEGCTALVEKLAEPVSRSGNISSVR
ncbi:low molecular weight phosphotyrosine protein phosphatase [Rhizobium sp. CFBP 8762]|uniref:low molecular weight protein-tyrosine-phosphatase n=1 Tax=Rhizobium sp. CFBP 8762 TaxID=2775279 RepID=UPI00177F79E2|nr:low molecular weight protein-tyrosine-phosphatase [Rhizobium sp. CFBP 8762]MBD8555459.1 low molecular weight phosphotyrosine protein phosphatase [Rhizobium sp. CFBP 8762]